MFIINYKYYFNYLNTWNIYLKFWNNYFYFHYGDTILKPFYYDLFCLMINRFFTCIDQKMLVTKNPSPRIIFIMCYPLPSEKIRFYYELSLYDKGEYIYFSDTISSSTLRAEIWLSNYAVTIINQHFPSYLGQQRIIHFAEQFWIRILLYFTNWSATSSDGWILMKTFHSRRWFDIGCFVLLSYLIILNLN